MFFQRLSQCSVRLKIQSGKAVIKNQDFRFLGNRSGNGKPLLLASGNIRSALGYRRLVLIIFLLDKVRRLSNFCRFLYFLF